MANRKVTKDVSDNIIAGAVMASSIRSGAARIIEAHASDTKKVTVNKGGYLIPVQIGNFWFLIDTATHVDSASDLDTGTVAASTAYYVYAVTDESTITFKTSLSSANPTGYDTAHSALLGGFTTDGSKDITAATIWDVKLKVTTGGYGMNVDGAALKGGTNTFNITNGTASLDVAAGATADINANITVESASAINQDVTSDASPTFAALKVTTGAALGKIPVSDADGDLTYQYRSMTNLLTNSQWIAASGSTLENVGSSIVGAWTNHGTHPFETWTLNADGKNIDVAANTADFAIAYNTLSLTVGKLYKVSFTFTLNSGTAPGYGVSTDSGGLASQPVATAGANSMVFEATAETMYFFFRLESGVASNFTTTSTTLYEVTPGYVAADTVCFDGWAKDTSLDVWRQHNDATYTKNGSFYAIKCTTAAADQRLGWPAPGTESSHIKKFAGRTVTMGAWVYASDASHARLYFYDSVNSFRYSAYHSGVAGWEWLEIPYTVASATTQVNFGFNFSVSGKTAYISQPMLVFGSSIGQGNYQPIVNEVIWLQNYKTSTLLNNKTGANGFSTTTATLLNIEADTSGVIGKGAKAIFATTICNDSGSAGTDCVLELRSDGSIVNNYLNSPAGLANDACSRIGGWQRCSANGDIYYSITATGANTFDVKSFRYTAIQT